MQRVLLCRRRRALLGLSELGLVVADALDLGRAGAARVEAVREPVGGELLGQLDADDALAEAEHLGVVGQDGALDGERVVGRHGADARHLVGGDGDAQAGAADEKGPVSLALCHELGGLHGDVRVGGLVGGVGHADVGHGGDEGVRLEEGLEGVLVGDAGVVAGHGDAEGSLGHFDGLEEVRSLEEKLGSGLGSKGCGLFWSGKTSD